MRQCLEVKPNPLELTTMRRVITPIMLALAFAAFTSVDASAGLFSKFGHGCDSGCHVEPACGCEVPACGCAIEPACGFEVACCDDPCAKRPGLLSRLFAKKHNVCCDAPCAEPVCGCEVVADPCCDSGCGIKRPGLLSRLFSKKNVCCDSVCAPAPTYGCEPTCGF